ncbi:site-specific DNA-methyltransferase [Aliikangiella marina]|uniref:Methyltransferase n=1 Tax=Aliikangiella marina TaxID=1712262 RepID=A0A545T6Y7_9GAMM|nr:site-specific DNA-methyltransferase [Aliikangiella marina]TQV72942.1 site-specific DNA-methyltransferase [Aliikangiella marina]
MSYYALTHGDAIDWLQTLPDESIDLVITDPPYESLEKHRAIGTTTRLKDSKSSSNQWFNIFPNNRFPDLFSEVFRVLKPNTHFYLFCDQETMFEAKPIGEKIGFKFWKPIVWDKEKIGMGYHYRARYEFILFFEKGKRKLNDLSIPDVLSIPRIWKGYPTEKPAALSKILVEQSTQENEIVIDPFFGSGSVGEASLSASRQFLGSDISDSALEHASLRLAAIDGTESKTPQDLIDFSAYNSAAQQTLDLAEL